MENTGKASEENNEWKAGVAEKMLMTARDSLGAVAKYAFDYGDKHALEASVTAKGGKMSPSDRSIANKGLDRNTQANFWGAAAVGAAGVALIAPYSLGAMAVGAIGLALVSSAMGGRLGYEAVHAAAVGIGAAAWTGQHAVMGIEKVADVLGGLAGRLLGRRAGLAAGSAQTVEIADAEVADAPKVEGAKARSPSLGDFVGNAREVSEGGAGGTYAASAPEPTEAERGESKARQAKQAEREELATRAAVERNESERRIRASNDSMLDYSRGSFAKGGQVASGVPQSENTKPAVKRALERQAAQREKGLASLKAEAEKMGIAVEALVERQSEMALKNFGQGKLAALVEKIPLAPSNKKPSGLGM